MSEPVLGVLLAGGLSRRMGGGDKCLRPLGTGTILDHVIGRIRPQVEGLLLNANGDPDRFSAFGLPVAGDVVEGFAGPLAGVLTGMEWTAEHRPDLQWIVTIATDTPFAPSDLVARMMEVVAGGADMACAASGGRPHPVIGLWPVALAGALRHAMVGEGLRKVDQWTGRYRLETADFAIGEIDPFFNANRPEDLAEAERILARIETHRI